MVNAYIKLEVLIEKIKAKRKLGANDGNRKVLIFTVYTDTATYLYDQLKAAGLGTVAMVSSGECHVTDRKEPIKDFENTSGTVCSLYQTLPREKVEGV